MSEPILLAYSGGLDTSFLIPYLSKKHGAKVICATINTGGLTTEKANDITSRARKLGAQEAIVIDARSEYFERVISYLIKGNVLRGGVYPLCVGAERVVQAAELVRLARERGVKKVAHGSTAAGNDQVRFEVYFRVLAPEIEILAPIRDEGIKREKEVAFLKEVGIDFPTEKARFSVNEGLWGKTIGSRDIQDPSQAIPQEAYGEVEPSRKNSESVTVQFQIGLPVALNGEPLPSVDLIERLHQKASAFGIGRGVHLGNTVLGIKGRIAFEAPAAAVLLEAHRELEKLVLTKWQQFWKGQLSSFYGEMLHEGQYLDPVMREIEAFLNSSQKRVNGTVTLKMEPGRVSVESCSSPNSLIDVSEGTYGEEALGWTGADAKGFARISANSTLLWQHAGKNK